MNAAVPDDELELIGYEPKRGYFGLDGSVQIEPGNPYRSILYYRIATKGAGHMPMIGLPSLDQEGIRVVHDWIRSLMPEAQIPEVSLEPENVEEALALFHAIQSGEVKDGDRKQALINCMSHADPFVVNLFAGIASD